MGLEDNGKYVRKQIIIMPDYNVKLSIYLWFNNRNLHDLFKAGRQCVYMDKIISSLTWHHPFQCSHSWPSWREAHNHLMSYHHSYRSHPTIAEAICKNTTRFPLVETLVPNRLCHTLCFCRRSCSS